MAVFSMRGDLHWQVNSSWYRLEGGMHRAQQAGQGLGRAGAVGVGVHVTDGEGAAKISSAQNHDADSQYHPFDVAQSWADLELTDCLQQRSTVPMR